MQENDKPVLIYMTFPAPDEAERVGKRLVESHLAACVNIIPGMTSLYRWEGAVNRDSEVVMIAKTRVGLKDRIIETVRAEHSYENPAILMVSVEGGSAPFLDWIAAETQPHS